MKSKLKEIINLCFFHKNGNRRFQYVVIGYKNTYFVRDHSDAPQKYSDADVIKMLEYLIDNIFVEFGGRIYQQTIGIPMGTNYAPPASVAQLNVRPNGDQEVAGSTPAGVGNILSWR